VFAWFGGARAGPPPARGARCDRLRAPYSAQLDAYLFLLTDRYRASDPPTALIDLAPRPEAPIRLQIDDRYDLPSSYVSCWPSRI
jgi:hypothetical protein